MVEMTMRQQKKIHMFQWDSVQPQVFDQLFSSDAATGINQRELPTSIDCVDIAIVIVRQRATQKPAPDEVNAIGNFQSSRSFE